MIDRSTELPIAPWRVYLLRLMYLFIVVGLALMIWPLLLTQTPNVEHMRGVVWSVLGAVCLLALLGLRYPLQMLPLLLFEVLWKAIWIVAIGLPLRMAGALEGGNAQTWIDCTVGVVLCLVAIPWDYVFDRYVRQPGTSWRLRRGDGVHEARLRTS
jgi:hypothetical protein